MFYRRSTDLLGLLIVLTPDGSGASRSPPAKDSVWAGGMRSTGFRPRPWDKEGGQRSAANHRCGFPGTISSSGAISSSGTIS